MMSCPECERLIGASVIAAERLLKAQLELSSCRLSPETPEFQRLWSKSEQALLMSAALREKTVEHLKVHRREP